MSYETPAAIAHATRTPRTPRAPQAPHAPHAPRSLHTGKRLWSYDLWRKLGDGGAPKRYLAATPEALAEAYATMAAVKRNVYEVITPEWPCVLYFDLEFARDEHGEQRAVSMEGEH